MSTTALLVEILIIGFEVVLWLLLLASLLQLDLISWPSSTSNNALVQAGALAGATYVLGIIADKTAKWVVEESSLAYLFHFHPPLLGADEPDEKKWPANPRVRGYLERLLRPDARTVGGKRPAATARPSPYLQQYAAVVAKSGDFMSDLFYGRSKVRILRASIFLLPLIVFTATAVWAAGTWRGQETYLWRALVAIAGGLLLAPLVARYAIWLYCYNRWLYRYRLDYFFRATDDAASPEG
jgi:hypothetical protein